MIAEGGPQRERPPELYPDHGPHFPLADLETAASQLGDDGVRDDIGHIVLGDDRRHFPFTRTGSLSATFWTPVCGT